MKASICVSPLARTLLILFCLLTVTACDQGVLNNPYLFSLALALAWAWAWAVSFVFYQAARGLGY